MIDLIHAGTMRETCQSHGCTGCLTAANVVRVLATPLVHDMVGRAALAQWRSLTDEDDRVASHSHTQFMTWWSAICYVVADMVGLGIDGLFQNTTAEMLIRVAVRDTVDARAALFASVPETANR
jgi:hypothetical protein